MHGHCCSDRNKINRNLLIIKFCLQSFYYKNIFRSIDADFISFIYFQPIVNNSNYLSGTAINFIDANAAEKVVLPVFFIFHLLIS